MSELNVSAADNQYQNENKGHYHTKETEESNTVQLQEEFQKETECNVQTGGRREDDILNTSNNVPNSRMVSQETVIDMHFLDGKPNVTPKNIFFHPRIMPKKPIFRHPYRKHQQNYRVPYSAQGYPPPGYPPQGYPPQGYPLQGYPPPGYPPPGYPPQGYPPQGYPPQGYPPQGYPQQGYPPQGGGMGMGLFGFPQNDEEIEPIPYDPATRNRFIRIVMLIVLIMLIATAIIVGVCMSIPVLRNALRKSGILILIPLFGVLGCNIAMCSECARKPPCVFIILLFTTIFMSAIAAMIACRFRTAIVLYAVIATASIVLACAILASTSFDFTKWYLYAVVIATGLSVVFLVILLGMFVAKVYIKPLHIGILIIAVIIESVILVMEMQMIIGGRSIQLDESEYGLGAFLLYVSIVQIFLKLMQIIGLMEG